MLGIARLLSIVFFKYNKRVRGNLIIDWFSSMIGYMMNKKVNKLTQDHVAISKNALISQETGSGREKKTKKLFRK